MHCEDLKFESDLRMSASAWAQALPKQAAAEYAACPPERRVWGWPPSPASRPHLRRCGREQFHNRAESSLRSVKTALQRHPARRHHTDTPLTSLRCASTRSAGATKPSGWYFRRSLAPAAVRPQRGGSPGQSQITRHCQCKPSAGVTDRGVAVVALRWRRTPLLRGWNFRDSRDVLMREVAGLLEPVKWRCQLTLCLSTCIP
jgi:hypothetical protein